jgi:hypothetical protein
MRKLLLVLSIVAVLSLLAAPAFAAESMTCDHSNATIQSLNDCVMHHVTNPGVANSLMATLDAAQAALVRGQTDVAINLLSAFINEINAQTGKFVPAEHAPHLLDHAQMVINALGA